MLIDTQMLTRKAIVNTVVTIGVQIVIWQFEVIPT